MRRCARNVEIQIQCHTCLLQLLLDNLGASRRARVREMVKPERPEILTAEEVAERLKVKKSWVYFAAADGRLRSHPVGRYVRFIWSEVEQDLFDGNLAA
jgi:excisionase family DNA binding protein